MSCKWNYAMLPKKHRVLIALSMALFMYTPLHAAFDEQHFITDAQLVGKARYSFLLWDVYDAALYAAQGQWQADKPFVLSLSYLMDLKGADIADRSVAEMRAQGFNDEIKLAAWHAQMRGIFPDVKKGSRLSAVFYPGKETRFFNQNRPIGTIQNSEFTAHFSNIWLGEKSSEPKQRKNLLGAQ